MKVGNIETYTNKQGVHITTISKNDGMVKHILRYYRGEEEFEVVRLNMEKEDLDLLNGAHIMHMQRQK